MLKILLAVTVCLAVFGILLFAALYIAVCICAHLPRCAKPADCIIVLGAKVRPDGNLSNTLRKRCDAALLAWQDGIADTIILCGGKGRDEPMAEADAMHAYLLQRGVPENALVKENQSKNTEENIWRAQMIMKPSGWQTAAIVTSDYHMQRALLLAKSYRIRAHGIPCASPDRPSHRIKSRLQETVSWFLYFLRKI